jgi:3-dehydroquinate synthase
MGIRLPYAFETVSEYSSWLHGEAVAVGMVCASRLAERRRLIGPDLTERQRQLLTRLGLPVRLQSWPVESLLDTMRRDKKTLNGRLRFVLPRKLGAASLCDDIPEADVREVLAESLLG